jgi:hypothetical protein
MARIKEIGQCMLHFGMGNRTCIGKNISLLEIYKLVPSFLRGFEVCLDDPRKEWKVHNVWFVKQSDFFTIFKAPTIVHPRTSLKVFSDQQLKLQSCFGASQTIQVELQG